ALTQALGVRNDVAPNRVHVSPRLGFTWVRGGASNNGAITFNPMGTFHMGPTSYIRGGIGEFRSMIAPNALADARALTGLPGAARGVTCVGDAAPAPQWWRFLTDPTAIPTACAGSAGALVDSTPSVRLFEKSYDAARSWRGNLSYSSQYRRLMYSVD